MNHIRRIAVILAGLAAPVLAFSAATPSSLAAPVPHPQEIHHQQHAAPLHECPSAVAAQPRIGKAWEHRRKFGGVGPAVGGSCLLNKADRYVIRTTPDNVQAGR